MSTLFLVVAPTGTCEVRPDSEREDIEWGRYEPVAFRSNDGWFRWENPIACLLPPETPVYPWDNSAQGIFTIGDIILEMEENAP